MSNNTIEHANGGAPSQGVNRRVFLGGSLGATALMALAGNPLAQASAAGAGLGPRRTVSMVFGSASDWMVYVATGAADAARMLGWDFRRQIGTSPSGDAAAQVTGILQAIQTRPDVILTADWYKGETSALHQAQQNGIGVVIINAQAFPTDMARLSVSFAGQDEEASGISVGTKLMDAAVQKGVRGGVILAGNPFPGPGPIQDRITGLTSAAKSYNNTHRTSFEIVVLNDQAAASPAQAVALYKAEMTHYGSTLVAHAVPGGVVSLPTLLTALKGAGVRPGSVPIGSWDNSPFIIDALKNGRIAFFEDQGFYYQGYFGVLLAWAALERLTLPVAVNTGGALIDSAALGQYIKQNAIMTAAAKTYGFA